MLMLQLKMFSFVSAVRLSRFKMTVPPSTEQLQKTRVLCTKPDLDPSSTSETKYSTESDLIANISCQ